MSADLPPIALGKPSYDEREAKAVADCLASGWVAGWGPNGAELEQSFAARVDTDHAVAVSSCTAGLHLALAAMGIGAGDEVIVADYTFPATGHAVLYVEATPVFVDVCRSTFCIDPERIEEAITDRTRAIIAVDQFGQCADWAALEQVAAAAGVDLIEDAACAAGASQDDREAGSFGRVGVFSLHGRKGISSGEGGVVTTDDADLAAFVRKASAFGIESARIREGAQGLPIPTFETLGWNYKLSDIQAAVALVQLDKLDELTARRNEIATAYTEAFAELPGWNVPAIAPGNWHTWQAYALTAPSRDERDALAIGLRSQGIGSNFGTYASHVQPIYDAAGSDCPVSADLFDRHVAIPMHADLTDAEVQRVIDAVRALAT